MALGKGLPALEAVMTKAEAEEQAKVAQSKLPKQGVKHEAWVKVSAAEDDKKGGEKAKNCSFCGRQGHGTNPDTSTRKKACPAFEKTCYKYEESGLFVSCCKKKKKTKGPDADTEHGAVTVEEIWTGSTKEAVELFGIAAGEPNKNHRGV